jgi:uncharacterized damage-inducible protein DinB
MQSDIGSVCATNLEFMKWADESFLAALSALPPEQHNHDAGSSFKSMLGTLNHVYLAERVWLKRLHGSTDARIADIPVPEDIAALNAEWLELHRMWLDWAASLSAEEWAEPLTFQSRLGGESTMPTWQIVMHVVNHGSYHRGQVATLLRQSGLTPPATDLILFYRSK